MPPRTAPMVLPVLLLLLLLVSARASVPPEEEKKREETVDPEVTTCRQQCVRQWQFSAAERRYCLRQCDEYGRAKRREEQREESPEQERDRCLHQCRVGPPKPGCERRCQEAYERATHGHGRGDDADAGTLPSLWWQLRRRSAAVA